MDKGMNELFERKAGEQPLDDLVPGYDKAAGWEALQPRIPQKKKRPVVLWAYAAAVLVGILTGALLMYSRSATNERPDNDGLVVNPVQKPVAPQVLRVHDTTVLYKEKTVVVAHAAREKKIMNEDVAQYAAAVPDMATQTAVVAPQSKQEVKEESQPIVAANTAKKPLPVMHLLDIDNEDRKYMTGGVKQLQSSSNMVLRISPSRLPDRNSEGNGPLLRNIFK